MGCMHVHSHSLVISNIFLKPSIPKFAVLRKTCLPHMQRFPHLFSLLNMFELKWWEQFFHFLVQERSITMFLSVAVLPQSVDSVACDFFPICVWECLLKKTMGRLVFKTLYSPILGLVCTVFEKVGRWFMLAMCLSKILQVFSHKHGCSKCADKHFERTQFSCNLGFSNFWPRNVATQHWNNRFPII